MNLHILVGLLLTLLSTEYTSGQSLRPAPTPSIANDDQQARSPLEHGAIRFRDATEADIDDIVTIIIDAFSPSAAWHYVKPHWQEYKEYEWYCLRQEVRRAWRRRPENGTWIKVITVPNKLTNPHDRLQQQFKSQPRNERAVSLAIWRELKRGSQDTNDTLSSHIATKPFRSHSPWAAPFGLNPSRSESSIARDDVPRAQRSPNYDCSLGLDVNQTRATPFVRQLRVCEDKYINDVYPHHLSLHMLATHPTWDGHGFAAHHLHWGMQLAQNLSYNQEGEGSGVPITLSATPAGFPLYDSEGFESIKNCTVQMLDGLGELWVEIMKWDRTV